jgi:hypothetical protein
MRDLSQLKPLKIIVIPDGVFTDDAESVITHVAQQLGHPGVHTAPWDVGIQCFQVSDDEPERNYLRNLITSLSKGGQMIELGTLLILCLGAEMGAKYSMPTGY